jgi:predicted MFS family arabinose efflux permease
MAELFKAQESAAVPEKPEAAAAGVPEVQADAGMPGGGVLGVLSVFKKRHFGSLWLGMLTTNVAMWVHTVSLQWTVHETKDDPKWLGYCLAATWGASIVMTPAAGVLADRLDCRKLMIAMNVALLALALIMAGLSGFGLITGTAVIGAAIIAGACNAIYAPASQTLLPRIVGQEHVGHAVALNAVQFNTSRAVGPGVGGWFLTVMGTTAGFLASAASFAGPVIALMLLPRGLGVVHSTAHKHPLRSLLEAVSYAGKRADVLLVLATVFVASFAMSPVLSLIPAYVQQCYDNSPGKYSAMLSMFGIGAIVGVPLVASRVKGLPNPWLGLPLLASFAVMNLALAWAPDFMVTRGLMFVAGLSFIGATNRMLSFMVTGTPAELRGRVISMHYLVFSTGLPLGSFIYGYAAAGWGMRAVFAVNGAALLMALGVLAFLARKLISQSFVRDGEVGA